jgi:translation initiation factor 1
VDDCACPRKESSAGDGVVRVSRETKGRRGKAVTVVTGAPLDARELDDLAKRLKTLCGAGGTVKGGRIEIQGDHRDRVVPELESRGWTVKKSGG